MHDASTGHLARRKLKTTLTKAVEYADQAPSAFASMLGGLIEANVESRPARRKDFDSLAARVGIWVTDIDEGVTLDFRKGSLVVAVTRAHAIDMGALRERILANELAGAFDVYDVEPLPPGDPLRGRPNVVEGLLGNLATLNTVARIFSVQ